MPVYQLRYDQTADARQPFTEWLASLDDRQARARIQARIARIEVGDPGDVEPIGGGVLEFRVDWGPGYRDCFARIGQVMVLLLCGGDKRTQPRDIERAKTYFENYKVRSAGARPPRRRT